MGNWAVANKIHDWFWNTLLPQLEESPTLHGRPWGNLPRLNEEGYHRALYNDYHITVLYKFYPMTMWSSDMFMTNAKSGLHGMGE
jgi:hypothetical protein